MSIGSTKKNKRNPDSKGKEINCSINEKNMLTPEVSNIVVNGVFQLYSEVNSE